MKKKTVDIILPNKIGDSILALPVILSLKQLTEKYCPDKFKIRIYSSNDLTGIFKSFDLFETKRLTYFEKFKSWLFPSNEAFFLYTSSKNIGFHSKKTYGQVMSSKKFARYDVDMPYIEFPQIPDKLSSSLFDYLKNMKLSTCNIRYFGMLLDLGFTAEQIIAAFGFKQENLNLGQEYSFYSPKFLNDKYLVFCMEAAGNRINDADRRWDEQYYIELAQRAYDSFGLKAVFIGINNKFKIPAKDYFIDLRKKLTIPQTAKVLEKSVGYVGNDTGPLHMANLMKKPSVGIYFRENSLIDYRPLFPELIIQIFKPESTDQVFLSMKTLFKTEFLITSSDSIQKKK